MGIEKPALRSSCMGWNHPHKILNSLSRIHLIDLTKIILIFFFFLLLLLLLLLLFNWVSLHARLNSHCKYWSNKKKKHKKIKAYSKSLYKETTVNRCLLVLDLKPFRLQVKGKHSLGREFQSLAEPGNKLFTGDWNGGMEWKIMQSLRIMTRSPTTSTKVIL